MIKIIGRLLLILLVACIVAGGLYWLVQSDPSLLGSQGGLRGGLGDRIRSESLEGLDSEEGAFGGSGSRRSLGGGNFEHNNESGVLDARALGSIGRNLLVIALITLAVLAIQKALSFVTRRRLAKAVQTQDM